MQIRYTPNAIPAGLNLTVQLLLTPPAPAAERSPRSPQKRSPLGADTLNTQSTEPAEERTARSHVSSWVSELLVATETEVLRVPLRASVLSVRAFEQLSPPPLPAVGVKCLRA